MPSLIKGYEYDIFISYRQKDNKADKWVTHFVEALKDEIEATFKEDISIYFDENPHDGLLETHDVDQSLSEKIKVLILIPIISQTYCDPNCFAWQHEFIAFRDFAKEDELGLDIRLASGNVCKRILPIRIHEIDAVDQQLYEKETGGVMRPIDFIYHSPGVNRPLRPNEEHPDDNLYKTLFIDQINKVANGVKEIVYGLINPYTSVQSQMTNDTVNTFSREHKPITKKKLIYGFLALIIIFASILIFVFSDNLFVPKAITNPSEISIAIIPFRNNTGREDQRHLGLGFANSVRNELSQSKKFDFISALEATTTYWNRNISPQQMGKDLKVNYLLTGMYQTSEGKIQVNVELVDAASGEGVWNLVFNEPFENIFDIQLKIAKRTMIGFDIKSTTSTSKTTHNLEAYGHYLNGLELYEQSFSTAIYWKAYEHFSKAVEIDSNYLEAWLGMISAKSGIAWFSRANNKPNSLLTADEVLVMVNEFDRRFPNAWQTHLAHGYYFYLGIQDFNKGLSHFKEVLEFDPENIEAISYWGYSYNHNFPFEQAIRYLSKAIELKPNSGLLWHEMGHLFRTRGEYEFALKSYNNSSHLGFENDNIKRGLSFDLGIPYPPDSLAYPINYWSDTYLFKRDYQSMIYLYDTCGSNYAFWKIWAYYLLEQKDSTKKYADLLDTINNPTYKAYQQAMLNKKRAPENYRNAYTTFFENEDDLMILCRMKKNLIEIYSMLGRYEEATQLLMQMNNDHPEYGDYAYVRTNPGFDKIKAEYPPFVEALENLRPPPLIAIEEIIKL